MGRFVLCVGTSYFSVTSSRIVCSAVPLPSGPVKGLQGPSQPNPSGSSLPPPLPGIPNSALFPYSMGGMLPKQQQNVKRFVAYLATIFIPKLFQYVVDSEIGLPSRNLCRMLSP